LDIHRTGRLCSSRTAVLFIAKVKENIFPWSYIKEYAAFSLQGIFRAEHMICLSSGVIQFFFILKFQFRTFHFIKPLLKKEKAGVIYEKISAG